ncbi:MAG TPA: alanine dehydrogenase [Balneolales bacterium]|nr:alanine dehydrogenase [Balneolales bacterium]
MEIINPSNFPVELGIKTLEKRVEKEHSNISLKIGLPKERSNDEKRICLTPSGVSVLVANGHEIYIEKNAGSDANFSDQEYADAGANIAYSTEDLYKKSEMVVKVAPPIAHELNLMQKNQILLSAVHLGNQTGNYFRTLLNKNIAGIGFEFIREPDNTFPIVRMMHEITGSMAVQIAAHYLENTHNGQGIMLGGISGVPPANVVILGGGIIAEYAARTALGYGAQVFVLDTNLARLRHLENALDRRIITAIANHQYLSSALKYADVVIGSPLEEGNRAPCWVTEPMVNNMKDGSVIVDTVIDQGGCVATSEPTTHSNPVFVKHGVLHFCVPNIPSSVARTATYALNNVIGSFLLEIGDAGSINKALWANSTLRQGVYSYKGHITQKNLSKMFDLPFRDIDMLIASQI